MEQSISYSEQSKSSLRTINFLAQNNRNFRLEQFITGRASWRGGEEKQYYMSCFIGPSWAVASMAVWTVALGVDHELCVDPVDA